MRQHKFVGAIVIMIALLTGCATTRIAPEKMASIKKVGVISLVAHEFYRDYVGLTVFGNEHEKIDISSWKVDDEYESQIQNALAALGRFEVVRVSYDRKEFYPVYDVNGPWDAPAFRTPKWSAVESKFKRLADQNSLNALVVVISLLCEDFLGGSNQYFRGPGFYARGIGGMTAVSAMHLVSGIAVIDGLTGKTMAIRVMKPIVKVPPELSRAKLGDIGEQRASQVRSMLIDLPKDRWEPIFKALFAD